MNHYGKTMIRPNISLRLVREMKKDPKRVWLREDFRKRLGGGNYTYSRHLDFLVRLGVLEQVHAVYNSIGFDRTVKGYKLIQKIEGKDGNSNV